MRATRKLLGLLGAIACLGMSLASAGEIQVGSTMRVKANSIWFEDAAGLTRWQQVKKAGDAAVFASYQEGLLSNRDAWRFTEPHNVKILGYERRKHQVKVEMQTTGRLRGSTWVLDADALGP